MGRCQITPFRLLVVNYSFTQGLEGRNRAIWRRGGDRAQALNRRSGHVLSDAGAAVEGVADEVARYSS